MKRRNIWLCLLLLLLVSCTQLKDRYYLQQAEKEIHSNPAHALILLDSVQYVIDLSRYDRNNYKFLCIHARNMLKMDISLYSSITRVARYFEEKGEIYKTAWSYYYAGKIAHLKGDYKNASIYLSESKEYNTNLQDTTLLFYTYYYMGELYSQQHDRQACIEAYKEALRYASKLPDEAYLSYKIGDCYLNINQYVESMNYYIDAENKLMNVGDSLEMSHLCLNISRSYYKNDNPEQAVEYLYKALSYNKSYDFCIQCNMELANIYLKSKTPQIAFQYLNRIPIGAINGLDQLNDYYFLRSQLYELKRKYKEAYQDYQQFHLLSDSLKNLQTNQRIDNIVHRHQKKKLSSRNIILIKQRLCLVLSIVSLLLIFSMIVLYVSYLIRKKENKYIEACGMIEMLEKLNQQSLKYENKFKEVLLEKLEISRRLALISSQSTDKNKSFLRLYNEIMGDLQKHDLDWSELYFSINYIYDNFYERLIRRFPALKEKEIQVCCLLRAGFRTDEIAFVMQQSVNTIHKHKTIIRKTLKMGERIDIIEWLLKSFDN